MIPYARLTACTALGLLLLPGLVSCSLFSSGEDGEQLPDPNDPTLRPDYIPEQLKAGFREFGAGANARIEAVDSLDSYKSDAEKRGVTLTDPDHPDKEIKALDQAFKMKNSSDWEVSFTEARREAMRHQKPIIMWFADSRRSPNSNQLSTEVLSKEDFADWAAQKAIRLRLDRNVTTPDKSLRNEQEVYLDKLAEQYKVQGYPRMFILTPDGQQVDDIRGYISGTSEYVTRRIKNSVSVAAKQFTQTKKNLESQGFREWKGRNGAPIFAKLYKYTDNGPIILQEPDGHFLQTRFNSLSSADMQWILDEKKKRAAQ